MSPRAGDRGGTADRHALQRLLDRPELARVAPHLPPDVLHRLIRNAGLQQCVDVVAAATREQLAAILDLDLWGAAVGGADEELDADRFGEWLEALVDRDAATAARVVARFERSLLVTGLSRYLRVIDPGTLQPTESTDDEPRDNGLFALERSLERHLAAGTPWLARDDLDVLAALDTPAWHGLLGLLGECPVVPAIVTAIVERRTGRVDPNAFAFIATTADIETVRAFVARLPELLAGRTG